MNKAENLTPAPAEQPQEPVKLTLQAVLESLDKALQRVARNTKSGAFLPLTLETPKGKTTVKFSRSEHAKCRSRQERLNYIFTALREVGLIKLEKQEPTPEAAPA